MASTTQATPEQELIFPDNDEHEALIALSKLLGHDTTPPLRLVAEDGSEIELPKSARHALHHAIAGLANKQVVSVQSVDSVLTVAQVRAMLGADMSYVQRVLESEELPSTVVNGIRRIDLRDAVEFKQYLKDQHEAGMLELVRLSEEMGLYDLEPTE